MTYILHLRYVLISGIHMAVIYEAYIAIGCVLAHKCKKDGSICQHNIMLEMYHDICSMTYERYMYSDVGAKT